jgi:GrpB-like predicted nucleotidyltransferase (UPF0157 family)
MRLQPHDPGWASSFDSLAATLLPALAGLPVTVEHVGSTAVPGLGGFAVWIVTL